MKVELRVAKVLAAERVREVEEAAEAAASDVGTEQRTLVAGIAEAYEPDALVGKTVVIVFNLKPAKLMGIESERDGPCGELRTAASPKVVTFASPPEPGTCGSGE